MAFSLQEAVDAGKYGLSERSGKLERDVYTGLEMRNAILPDLLLQLRRICLKRLAVYRFLEKLPVTQIEAIS